MELPYRLHLGDCLQVLKTFPDNSFDSVVTDPPYGLSFMGKRWDYDVPSVEIWAECLRVLKPGGHLLAFAGTRTQHRMALRIEDAGFEIRDIIAWVYGSGFPKSKNLDGDWQGWGTALKPALEPITVARKPLAGTVAANVLAHGTGTLNIDGCRINPTGESRERVGEATQDQRYTDAGGTNFAMKPGPRGGDAAGRWPANLIHDGSAEVLAAFPDAPGQQGDLKGHSRDRVSKGIFGDMKAARDALARGDEGSAARFFYCAKASRKDRNEGCDELPQQRGGMVSNTSGQHITRRDGYEPPAAGNHHPTVKPTDLMAYLVRLVTPPGGKVIDPFTGSGSTGKAAVREGFEFVGIEREPPYLAIAEARIAHELERVTAAALETAEAEAQLDIFRDAKEQIA
ncbi:site-specific DNA-methyltransferase [Pseudomonas aeruginosa]|uniref:DNA-methyltransferase n=1 Tax=Pseudomonas aeruginosa TaxID=287 RepID=UPI0009F884AE|nr:site-specific DNA-methyltransferase [Pseudomonas aeruginosa]MCA6844464.1 site-specific DNA-methyltransferase [Pseudomonas aeruginosa]ORE39725.1 site-specific DNA-methyltransferase [Pseudomonas aeruginosa]QZV37846.1 site-specific DNA-methyltransferase [Pseudomonas aeruginosa]HCF1829033.1 site-specific DNA-methyltransferase [Pseudomonas aeruginosa]